MKSATDMKFDTLEKVLTDSGAQPGSTDPPEQTQRAALPPRLSTDPETAADDLAKLVLAVIDTVRQLMEKQAIRRVESGVLSDAEIERLGLTLMQLETRMAELKAHFGLADEDLDLHFGSVQDLKDILNDEG